MKLLQEDWPDRTTVTGVSEWEYRTFGTKIMIGSL